LRDTKHPQRKKRPGPMEARKLPTNNPLFPESRREFEGLAARLATEACMSMTHSELEALLETQGREVLRKMFEEQLAMREGGQAAEAVVGEDGVERTHQRRRTRRLITALGEVEVERVGYGQRDVDSRFPLDASLNLPPTSYSLGLRRKLAYEAAKDSFDDAVEAVELATGVLIPKRQAEEEVRRAAVDFDAFYAGRAPAKNLEAGGLLILSTDGKGVSMRRDALRPATRKAAEERRPRLEKRVSKGEKTATRRMAQVATVYSIEPYVRTTEEIAGTLGPTARGESREPTKRPKPVNKRVWASVRRDAWDVIEEAFDEADRRDPERRKRHVALVDGGEHQLEGVLLCCGKARTHVTVILDVIHVLEYLWDAANALLGEGEPETEAWVTERLLRLLRGQVIGVAAGMRRSATKRGLPPTRRRAIDRCADYLLKYAEYLRYDEYLAAGFPISTGVIEGTCRYLVKDRMDITGARWGLDGAEAVLRLRALKASGDFDAYWAFHEQQELRRNHLAHYAHDTIPKLREPRVLRRKPVLSVVP
jgi:hypothetical protein